ncbi:MAG: DUF58 domain-containing protein, partial [Planctomycetota bacterium]
VWGLAVEGFLDRRVDETESLPPPTVALAFVRGLSTSDYRFSIQPRLRGHYPDEETTLTCSFPFGIWTARKPMPDVQPITVWPRVYPIQNRTSISGTRRGQVGEGKRTGRQGDFVGLRPYQQGDQIRQVNWTATARADSLIVTQRSGPQYPSLLFLIDTAANARREQIANRIRIAASLLMNLHESEIPMTLRVGRQTITPRTGRQGRVQMLDALADVPVDGDDTTLPKLKTPTQVCVVVSCNDAGATTVQITRPKEVRRSAGTQEDWLFEDDCDLAESLASFWREVCDANRVA